MVRPLLSHVSSPPGTRLCTFTILLLGLCSGYTYQSSSVSQIYTSINTPTIHYYGNNIPLNNHGWHSSNPDSWTRANNPTPSTSKSIFDPCPYGYRVPTSNGTTSGTSDFFGFTTPPTWNPATNIINGHTWLGSWWSTSGGRYFNSAALYGTGGYGIYWSASPCMSSTYIYYMYFVAGRIINPDSNGYRSSSISVRCVQE